MRDAAAVTHPQTRVPLIVMHMTNAERRTNLRRRQRGRIKSNSRPVVWNYTLSTFGSPHLAGAAEVMVGRGCLRWAARQHSVTGKSTSSEKVLRIVRPSSLKVGLVKEASGNENGPHLCFLLFFAPLPPCQQSNKTSPVSQTKLIQFF